MAELEGTQAITRPEILPDGGQIVPLTQGDGGKYRIEISDFTASGKRENFSIALPEDEKWGSIMLRAGLLKRTTWKTYDIPTILHAVVYADNLGLDIMAGDVYMATEGRLSTTADAKIKHGMASDRIEGLEFETTEGPEEVSIDYTLKGKAEVYKGPQLTTIVTLNVKGWKKPLVYKAKLTEWFMGGNPNWRNRPRFMLEKNAISKAVQLVAPMGMEADEAPPLPSPAPYYNAAGSPAPEQFTAATAAKARL